VQNLLTAVTVVLGAFLLFQVQPMLAKAILPWFGGSAAVWNTCMLFFQGVLFFGYAYAHGLSRRVPPRRQAAAHIALLVVSLAFLPVLPSTDWKPEGAEAPIPRILALLAASVGLPYLLLSSTSPLVQSWWARRQRALPYRYFALSNAASLAALIGYPIWIEPFFSLSGQSWLWSGGYVIYALCCATLAVMTARSHPVPAVADTAREAMPATPAPALRTQFVWLVLAASASVMSLSVTNHLCQNVAPMPFLWVLPLAAYLLSFIVAFERESWYRRPVFVTAHGLALAGAGWFLTRNASEFRIGIVVPSLIAALFFWCVFCHGELARRKPDATHLTHFYLMMSLGGALGAALVGIGAPYLLQAHYDLPIALAVVGMVTLMLEYRRGLLTDLAWTTLAVFLLVATGTYVRSFHEGARVVSRNFYGSLRVVDQGTGLDARRLMVHGVVNHGTQFLDPSKKGIATMYFGKGSGGQLAIENFRENGGPERVGIIGLGVGTLAAYGRAGDTYRFYELNPDVVDLARREFTFLSDSKAKVDVVVGDGRLSLERESPQNYDVFIVDAFSGDSIPVHLLTRECFDLYFRHIRHGGAVAVHVSNSALDVASVVKTVVHSLGKPFIEVRTSADAPAGRSPSIWVMVACEPDALDKPAIREAAVQTQPPPPRLLAWTDSYSSLFPILK
jgi:hypothetical protein